MNIQHSLTIALNGLKANKRRSLLTILGIVIGITSIILIMSIGEGAENLIVGELGGLGADTVVVHPGKKPEGMTSMADMLFLDSLKQRELDAVMKKSNVPDADLISPEVYVPGGVSYAGEAYGKAMVLGYSADFINEVFDLEIGQGESFDAGDIQAKARVAIIGSGVVDELFPNEEALGKKIKIKDQKFKVIGIYKPRGQIVFFNVDDLVIVPYSTALTYLSGVDYYSQINVSATSADKVNNVVADIEATLADLHDIDDPDEYDFNVQTQQGLVEQVEQIIGVFTVFLSFVVAVSLVVGGIGVMNIMLVSVAERTREIGLRKALGATDKNILTQFLTEAIALTMLGGVIGILLGSFLSFIVSFILSKAFALNWNFTFPISAALLGIFVSAVVGLVFGLYPAKQAAKKSPIEALRYE